ncbi:MAG: adenylate/guanylate cyclase, partial [Marinilabiliales bacterium]
TMSEKMTPQENFQFLNTYYSKIGPVIRHHSGFIDKYIGDGIMALFPEVPDDALDAAIEMQRRIRRFNSIFSKRFKFNVKSGIGIHTGSLILGMVGEEKRIDTTVISDAVNLASRMEGLTKIYKNNIIISEETYKKLESPEDYYCRYLDTVQVKGRKNPVTVLEVLNGLSPKILELKIKTKDMYENAISLYMEEETQKAQKLLAEVLKINPYDTPAKLLLQKMEQGDLSCK